MQVHATNMMYAANIISEDRTGFEHSICEVVKGQRKKRRVRRSLQDDNMYLSICFFIA